MKAAKGNIGWKAYLAPLCTQTDQISNCLLSNFVDHCLWEGRRGNAQSGVLLLKYQRRDLVRFNGLFGSFMNKRFGWSIQLAPKSVNQSDETRFHQLQFGERVSNLITFDREWLEVIVSISWQEVLRFLFPIMDLYWSSSRLGLSGRRWEGSIGFIYRAITWLNCFQCQEWTPKTRLDLPLISEATKKMRPTR